MCGACVLLCRSLVTVTTQPWAIGIFRGQQCVPKSGVCKCKKSRTGWRMLGYLGVDRV